LGFTVQKSAQFLFELEESAIWILESNIEQSEELALRKVDEFQREIEALEERLKSFPESGECDQIKGVRKFPIYEGRYSVKWVVQKSEKLITLISISDSKYPKVLRNVVLEDL
jgi:hypothetical protein